MGNISWYSFIFQILVLLDKDDFYWYHCYSGANGELLVLVYCPRVINLVNFSIVSGLIAWNLKKIYYSF